MSSAVSRSLRGSRIESCDHDDDDADEGEIVDAEQYEDLIFNGRDTHFLDPFQQLDDVGEEIENRVATEILGDSDVGHDRRGHGCTTYFVTNGRNVAGTA